MSQAASSQGRPAVVLVISGLARHRVALSKALKDREWSPVAVATWQRAAQHGLRTADAIVTDTLTLAEPDAEQMLASVPLDVPVFAVPAGPKPPRWAHDRVVVLGTSEIERRVRQRRWQSAFDPGRTTPARADFQHGNHGFGGGAARSRASLSS